MIGPATTVTGVLSVTLTEGARSRARRLPPPAGVARVPGCGIYLPDFSRLPAPPCVQACTELLPVYTPLQLWCVLPRVLATSRVWYLMGQQRCMEHFLHHRKF